MKVRILPSASQMWRNGKRNSFLGYQDIIGFDRPQNLS